MLLRIVLLVLRYLKILYLTLFLRFASRSLLVLSFRCICIVHSEFIFICYEVWIKAAVTAFVVVCVVLTFQLVQFVGKRLSFLHETVFIPLLKIIHTHIYIFIYASICLYRSISGLISLSINILVSLFANATVFIMFIVSLEIRQH